MPIHTHLLHFLQKLLETFLSLALEINQSKSARHVLPSRSFSFIFIEYTPKASRGSKGNSASRTIHFPSQSDIFKPSASPSRSFPAKSSLSRWLRGKKATASPNSREQRGGTQKREEEKTATSGPRDICHVISPPYSRGWPRNFIRAVHLAEPGCPLSGFLFAAAAAGRSLYLSPGEAHSLDARTAGECNVCVCVCVGEIKAHLAMMWEFSLKRILKWTHT